MMKATILLKMLIKILLNNPMNVITLVLSQSQLIELCLEQHEEEKSVEVEAPNTYFVLKKRQITKIKSAEKQEYRESPTRKSDMVTPSKASNPSAGINSTAGNQSSGNSSK
jgi:GTP cyclohydrolase FolE2